MSKDSTVLSMDIPGKPRSSRPAVLVVDSDNDFLNSLGILLESENCEIIRANGCDEAIEKIQGRQIDLLITDFMLKSKSSIELLILIRKSQPDVPIVVVTEHSDIITLKDIKMFGGNQLLPKPLEVSLLRGMVRSYCNPLHILN
ncbi:MAG: response regulator [Acidobacteriota bacterium]